jgi:asparagine synthase (glutamine-hydrolysing)
VAVEEIRRLLTESVRYRLVADVPVGAFLSGGIDSAAVVAEMSRQMDRPVDTYSIGFAEPRFNEAPAAAATAAALGTRHHELIVQPDVEALFERIVLAFDEPFADASAVPTFLVSELASADLKVVLSGDGGDELFGGYTRYLEQAARDVPIPAPLRRMLHHGAIRLPGGALGRNRLLELSRGRNGRYMGMVADPLAASEGGIADARTAAAVNWVALLDDQFAEAAGFEPSARPMLVDLLTYLPGDILTKVDRMSMAVSLETRSPLLDHELVEFAMQIPTALKFRDGRGKWIFRRAVEGLVPAEVLGRRKSGFGVPLVSWFRSELRHHVERLATPRQPLAEYVDERAVARVVREHLSGRRNHAAMLWKLIVLATWLERRAVAAVPAAIETADAPALAATAPGRS